MKISEAFPSNYLKASDLGGKAIKVTIDRVEIEDVTGKGEEKPILYFAGKSKGLVLNKTNASAISSKYGDDTDAWGGKPLDLYTDTTMFQGQMVPCLRVRTPVEVAGDDEEIPF